MLPVFRMNSDPDLTPPSSELLHNAANLPLWLKALEHPDSEFQRLAADAIVIAHDKGFPEIDSAKSTLLEVLSRPETDSAVRYAIANALIELDAREAAEAIFQASQQGDISFRLRVEPALAEWNYAPIQAKWLSRLSESDTSHRDLLLAINGLAKCKVASAVDPLIKLTVDPRQGPDVRLSAARGVGELTDSGREDVAQALASSPEAPVLDRLAAVAILHHHTSEAAKTLLTRLTNDPEQVVAADALDTLFRIDPSLVLPLAEQAIAGRNANVRWQGLRAYVTLPTPERVEVLGRSLDDVHPRNRIYVRDELFRLSGQPELNEPIRAAAMAALSRASWREQEQAALLLTALDHKAAAARLIELLESPRDEVLVAAAWGLKQLALPDTLPAMLDRATRVRQMPRDEATSNQIGHLFEAMAALDYEPGIPLMKSYVPKASGMTIARSTAIWALGHILEDSPDEELALQLIERAQDIISPMPEDADVRQQSMIAIGRMKVDSRLEDIKDLAGPERDPNTTDYAAAWAIHEISGETLPDGPRSSIAARGWFLESTEPPKP
jgi:HEAT repeat protein